MRYQFIVAMLAKIMNKSYSQKSLPSMRSGGCMPVVILVVVFHCDHYLTLLILWGWVQTALFLNEACINTSHNQACVEYILCYEPSDFFIKGNCPLKPNRKTQTHKKTQEIAEAEYD